MQSRYRRYIVGIASLGVISLSMLLYSMFSHPFTLLTGTAWIILLFYLVMLVMAWQFPILVAGQRIHILAGIVTPLFIQFGVSYAVALTCLSWFALELIINHELKWTRVSVNLSMLILQTILSAFAYFAVGGKLGFSQPTFALFVPVSVFFIVHFISNELLSLLFTYLRDAKIENWLVGTQWDLIAVLMDFVLAWLFIFLGHDGSLLAYFSVGIAFVGILYIFRLYSNLVFSNRQLSLISTLTGEMLMQAKEKDFLHKLIGAMPKILAANACYVFTYQKGVLVPIEVYGRTHESEEGMLAVEVEPGEGVTGEAYERQQEVLKGNRFSGPQAAYFEQDQKIGGSTVLAIPLVYNHEVLGVMTFIHVQPNAYSKRDIEMVRILANQAAISWSNARRFEQTRLETVTDSLTGAYNYRYFSFAIEEMFQRTVREKGNLTLLLLDLDHFKWVNDAYGHEAGNEILTEVTKILTKNVRDEDIVCRYGGEEFAILLPETTLLVGEQVAERLRIAIEQAPLLNKWKGTMPMDAQLAQVIPLRITVSVGVATYPDHAESSHTLILHADRAMYVGAKQAGRNRVSSYSMIKERV
nr:GGDEF domain-containing protein [Bacilli bacterium]